MWGFIAEISLAIAFFAILIAIFSKNDCDFFEIPEEYKTHHSDYKTDSQIHAQIPKDLWDYGIEDSFYSESITNNSTPKKNKEQNQIIKDYTKPVIEEPEIPHLYSDKECINACLRGLNHPCGGHFAIIQLEESFSKTYRKILEEKGREGLWEYGKAKGLFADDKIDYYGFFGKYSEKSNN